MHPSLSAIVLAAGQGTRMKSARPKVLHEVLGRPMVSRVVDAAQQAGAQRIVAVVGHGREEVIPVLEGHAGPDLRVSWVVQHEQRGTADAVRCALEAMHDIDGYILILYGDVPNTDPATLRQLVELRARDGIALITTRVSDPNGYGRMVRKDGAVTAIVEHKDCTAEELAIDEINAGLYCVHTGFLREHLATIASSNAARELYLTDLVAIAAGLDGAHAVCVDDPREVEGVNDRVQLAAATRFAQEKVRQRWMRAGVTLHTPESTTIEERVVLEQDVTIAAGVALRGATHVARGAVLDVGVVTRDARIGEGAHVGAYAVLNGVSVAKGARVLAHTHLSAHEAD